MALIHKIVTPLNPASAKKRHTVLNEIAQSALASILIIFVFYYSFARADRDYLFLYGHYGWGAFHPMTTGRYWMTGLILSFFITLFYTIINFLAYGAVLIKKNYYTFPSWKHVWLFCEPAIAGIGLIIMSTGSPVLPLSITTACALVMSSGLALGLYATDMFLRDSKKFFILSLDAIALIPLLMMLKALELPSKGILTIQSSVYISLGSIIFAFIFLIITSFFFRWKNISPGKSYEIFLISLYFTYLVLPALHFLLATPPGRPYITSSSNFFADSLILKFLTPAIAFIIIFLTDKFRVKFLKNEK